ncbi:MAG TPA: DUF2865 domain-containing protein [Bauldia sp.]|nr:DUF2865 domain-containing protein [Bauldia sp.]
MNAVCIVAATAALLASSAALAESPICAPMQAQYTSLLRQTQPNNTNTNAIIKQLAAAKADEQRGNCNRFLFFGPPKSPACPAIQATISQLQQQLAAVQGQRSLFGGDFGPTPEEQKAALQMDLQQNGCSIPSLSTPGRTLCVRTCDGYYFPINNRISSKGVKADAAACQAMYGQPGIATLYLQRSDDVADARSADGKLRYGDQAFAFLYRDSFNAACHAELKDGMAALEATKAGQPVTPIPDATPVAVLTPVDAVPADSQAALQAISTAQPIGGKHPVRFVGAAYYETMFAYGEE